MSRARLPVDDLVSALTALRVLRFSARCRSSLGDR